VTSTVSADLIDTGVIRLDLDAATNDPALRYIARCIKALQPFVDEYCRTYGRETTMVALVVIVANQAIDHGNAALTADILRENADMLDKEAELASLHGRA